jgi:hypothetical protein
MEKCNTIRPQAPQTSIEVKVTANIHFNQIGHRPPNLDAVQPMPYLKSGSQNTVSTFSTLAIKSPTKHLQEKNQETIVVNGFSPKACMESTEKSLVWLIFFKFSLMEENANVASWLVEGV